MLFSKFRYWRSRTYRMWVASLPCIACGIDGFSQCAHSNLAIHGKGRSIKASDEFTFPLCGPHWGVPGCHWQFDQGLDSSRQQREADTMRWIEQTQARAMREGFRLAA